MPPGDLYLGDLLSREYVERLFAEKAVDADAAGDAAFEPAAVCTVSIETAAANRITVELNYLMTSLVFVVCTYIRSMVYTALVEDKASRERIDVVQRQACEGCSRNISYVTCHAIVAGTVENLALQGVD